MYMYASLETADSGHIYLFIKWSCYVNVQIEILKNCQPSPPFYYHTMNALKKQKIEAPYRIDDYTRELW